MVRPLRIEYENAIYHVMNRGKGRKLIFPGTAYYEEFLKGVEEAHQRFGIEILAPAYFTHRAETLAGRCVILMGYTHNDIIEERRQMVLRDFKRAELSFPELIIISPEDFLKEYEK